MVKVIQEAWYFDLPDTSGPDWMQEDLNAVEWINCFADRFGWMV
jgi:hypothetical protein